MKILRTWLGLLVLLLAGCGKEKSFKEYDNSNERSAFEKRFNAELREELEKAKADLEKEIAELEEGVDGSEKTKELEVLERRLKRPDYFERLTEADLPDGLNWEDGMDEPELGSEEAKKGGTLHSYFAGLTFPPTIRQIGAEANNSFRSCHYDDVEMKLVDLHPNTMGLMPSIADRWAVGEDGQSVYFHLADDARWSDGLDVTSEDWMMAFYMYLSPYLTESFYRIYFKEQFWGVSTYGDDYVCIRIASPKPLAPYFAGGVNPVHREFFREFGPDFEDRYNWRPRPTTGAYEILPENIVKGRSITMTRVKDWWAKDRKYYKNRFNPDRIEYRLYRDTSKVFELFLRGDLDLHLLGTKNWYENTEVPKVFDGYIERATFYNEFPRPSWGIYFNLSRPLLDNRDVRIGLCHATNWQKVIDLDLRGDAERKNVVGAGYGEFSPDHIKAREFSVEKAREAFARAGFTKRGKDGIFEDVEGRRLSFTLNYTTSATVDPLMLRLKEEAKKAGVEYKLEGMDGTASFQKVSRKEHEIGMMAWVHSMPVMDYHQYFHTVQAFEPGTRKPRPMTNNVTVYSNPELDPVLDRNRSATTWDEVKETAFKIEETVHEDAVWVPGFDKTFYRVGYWRWIRWPDDFNVRLFDEPEPAHVLWIDEEMKKETLEAMRTGRKFEEVNRVFDQYRGGSKSENEREPEAIEEPVDDNALEPESEVGPELLEELEPRGEN